VICNFILGKKFFNRVDNPPNQKKKLKISKNLKKSGKIAQQVQLDRKWYNFGTTKKD